MFDIAVYLAMRYLPLALVTLLVLILGKVLHVKLWLRIVPCVLLMILPWVPYLRVEYLTVRYWQELESSAVDSRDLTRSRICLHKVLEKSHNRALVYVVVEEDGRFAGLIRPLVHYEGRWGPEHAWGTVWSDTGNAHGSVYPPYPVGGEYYGGHGSAN